MDLFCMKQFAVHTSSGGQHIGIPCEADEFVRITNAYYAESGGESALAAGYAPFCKHLFVPADRFSFRVPCSYAAITTENKCHLESTYSARTDKELPVLTRFFSKGSVQAPEASWIDVILYSRQQINKENEAMKGKNASSTSSSSDSKTEAAAATLSDALSTHAGGDEWSWGVVSIKPQTVSHELPMNPITIMRNTLIEEGGSGVRIDRDAYMKSVAFWQEHATV